MRQHPSTTLRVFHKKCREGKISRLKRADNKRKHERLSEISGCGDCSGQKPPQDSRSSAGLDYLWYPSDAMTSNNSSNVIKRRRFEILYASTASANSTTSGRPERLPSLNCRRSNVADSGLAGVRRSMKSGLCCSVAVCCSMKSALLIEIEIEIESVSLVSRSSLSLGRLSAGRRFPLPHGNSFPWVLCRSAEHCRLYGLRRATPLGGSPLVSVRGNI